MPSSMKAGPIDYAALKTELNTDPNTLGYAPLIAIGNDQGLADMLNLRRAGAPYSVYRDDIQPKEIVEAIAAADFTGATQIIISKLQLMFASAPIDATLANVRGNLQGIFSAASQTTKDALAALASREGSRAEVLFGIGTVITVVDIARALRQTP